MATLAPLFGQSFCNHPNQTTVKLAQHYRDKTKGENEQFSWTFLESLIFPRVNNSKMKGKI